MAKTDLSNLFVPDTTDVGLGLSTLWSIAYGEINFPEAPRLAVPDNLVRLAEHALAGSETHALFLDRVIRNFQPQLIRRREDNYSYYLAIRFARNLLEMRGARRIEILEEIDEMVLTNLGTSFPNYVVSLSPPSYFIRLYLAKLYSWSLKKKGLIIERGRRLINSVSHVITTIQYPDRLVEFFSAKDKFSHHLFARAGGRPVKYFVCIAIAGLGITYFSAGVAGLVIAVVDP